MSPVETVNAQVAPCRRAQVAWAARPIRERLRFVRTLRHSLVDDADELTAAIHRELGRPPHEALASDVLPFADACRFLEREAERLLKPRKVSLRSRPIWLWGQRDTIYRRPHGVVAVIGTWNYPVFLNGVQMAQALVAGNGVVWKPSEVSTASAPVLHGLFLRAGFPPDLVQLLPSSREYGPALAEADIDHVVFTGSAATGQKLATKLGERLVSSTLELSGCDAMFVLPDADVEMAAKAAWFGMTANNGQTCIAVRRAFVAREIYPAFVESLQKQVAAAAPMRLATEGQIKQADRLVKDAEQQGARVLQPAAGPLTDARTTLPRVVADATPAMALNREDCFAPLLAVLPVLDADDAVEQAEKCWYGLGASLFTADPSRATEFAGRIRSGMLTVNDVIVPTAHPATPFGGRGRSGWGVTQGPDGLIGMTVPQVVSVRGGKFRPHYEPMGSPDGPTAQVAQGLLAWCHGRTVAMRWKGLWQMVSGIRRNGQLTERTAPRE
ncbi:MAG TPA: aldehyde dehydrogenase family protein [Gemmataceae bacterium]|nr:aldehyde dehydrogenase family protein [Gemmataceae bacterium]